ncbi:MAG: OmpA family protein [Flavobacteriales bacterium]|nr:OmpA family protein [Flavobacteriales bacterium]
MNRHIAISIVLLGSLQLTASTSHQELIVHFEKDVSALNEQAIDALDRFLASVTVQGDYHFAVEGHTDSDGSNTYNDTLALARAQAVRTICFITVPTPPWWTLPIAANGSPWPAMPTRAACH